MTGPAEYAGPAEAPAHAAHLKAARAPFEPKAHGAWLGAGAGAAVAQIVVGLLQSYVTHRALPAADVQLVYTASTALVAALGAWLAPHAVRPGDIALPAATRP